MSKRNVLKEYLIVNGDWELGKEEYNRLRSLPNYRHTIIMRQGAENKAIPYSLKLKAVKEADYKYPDSNAVWDKLDSVITELYNEIILGMGEDY